MTWRALRLEIAATQCPYDDEVNTHTHIHTQTGLRGLRVRDVTHYIFQFCLFRSLPKSDAEKRFLGPVSSKSGEVKWAKNVPSTSLEYVMCQLICQSQSNAVLYVRRTCILIDLFLAYQFRVGITWFCRLWSNVKCKNERICSIVVSSAHHFLFVYRMNNAVYSFRKM